jgi:hypothetical protein
MTYPMVILFGERCHRRHNHRAERRLKNEI